MRRTTGMTASDTEKAQIGIFDIFISFLKLGSVAFGGPAMVANIRDLAVNKKKWIDAAAFNRGVALCQMIPGATAMQTAAYTGFKLRGVPGASAAFIGFGLPAFIFMFLLSVLYSKTSGLPAVISVFTALRAVIIAIIAHAAYSFGRNSLHSVKDILFAVIIAALYLAGMNPFIVILIASLAGILLLKSEAIDNDFNISRNNVPFISVFIIILTAAAGLVLLYFLNAGLFSISVIMLKVDLFAFGGGFNSLPLMYHEIVEARGLMDNSVFMNGIALGQITPGPIVITSVFAGYLIYGAAGAAVSAVSIFLPSFLMVVISAGYFEKLNRNIYFRRAVKGILISFTGLLLYITVHFSMDLSWTLFSGLIAAAAFTALMLKVKIHWIAAVTVALSLLVYLG